MGRRPGKSRRQVGDWGVVPLPVLLVSGLVLKGSRAVSVSDDLALCALAIWLWWMNAGPDRTPGDASYTQRPRHVVRRQHGPPVGLTECDSHLLQAARVFRLVKLGASPLETKWSLTASNSAEALTECYACIGARSGACELGHAQRCAGWDSIGPSCDELSPSPGVL
jgi:hypothetical protein